MTFLAHAIIQFEGTVQLQVVIGITKAAIAVAVPQQTIVLVGENKRHRHFRVILEEVLVLTFHIKFLTLMLSETIESLILRRVELHLPGQTVFCLLGHGETSLDTQLALRHREGLKQLSFLSLFQQLISFSIEERHLTSSFRHDSLHILSLDNHRLSLLTHGIGILGRCRLRHNHQRGRFQRQRLLRCGPHSDNVVINHFETNHLGLSTVRSNRHLFSLGLHHSSRYHTGHHQCRCHHTNSFHYVFLFGY